MPANTPSGYPYPLPTEPVAEGAQAIRNLAEAVGNVAESHLIQTITLTGAGSITFSAIPQIYQDLRIRLHGKLETAADEVIRIRLNAIAAGYYTQRSSSEGATFYGIYVSNAAEGSCGYFPDKASASSGWCQIEIPGYRDTTLNRIWISRGSKGAGKPNDHVGTLFQTVAVTSILLFSPVSFAAGSRASLYGIRG